MMNADPVELVQCGNKDCGAKNSVPFGIEMFQCYQCGVRVRIERPESSCCAAGSAAAREILKTQQQPATQDPVANQSFGDASASQVKPKGDTKRPSMFGKLENSLKKAENSFWNWAGSSDGPTKPPPQDAKKQPLPVGGTPNSTATARFDEEEDPQLQLALSLSLQDQGGAPPKAASNVPPLSTNGLPVGLPPRSERATPSPAPGGYPSSAASAAPATPSSAAASPAPTDEAQQLLASVAAVTQKMNEAEQRAQRAEAELEKAQKRLAEAEALSKDLQMQLQTQQLSLSSSEQLLQSLEAEVKTQKDRGNTLEQQVAVLRARESDADGEQGVVDQLLARIGELESQIVKATHFAGDPPPAVGAEPPIATEAAQLAKAIAASEKEALEAEQKKAQEKESPEALGLKTAGPLGDDAPLCPASFVPEDSKKSEEPAKASTGSAKEEEDDDSEDEGEFVPPPLPARKRRVSCSAEADEDKEFKLPSYPKDDEAAAKIRAAIEGSFAFQGLETDQLQAAIAAFKEEDFPAKKEVISQFEEDERGLFVVSRGTLRAFKRSSKDVEAPGAEVRCYDGSGLFGELALLYSAPRAATVIADTDCSCFTLERDAFRFLARSGAAARREALEAFMGSVELLQSLQPLERMRIAEALRPESFRSGEVVIQQGAAGSTMYFVESGKASASKEGEKVMEYDKGSYFGELALLRDTPRAATVTADTDLRLLALDRDLFSRLLGPLEDLLRERAEELYRRVATPE